MPRLRSIGLAPAATLRRPSFTMAWASTVAVVVPSPARSPVLDATSFTSCAPMFWKASSSSISRATVTPSLVMCGAPNFFSMITLRPLGPSVTFTASARASTPFLSSSRALILNLISFAMTGIVFLRRKNYLITARTSDWRIIRYFVPSNSISVPAYLP